MPADELKSRSGILSACPKASNAAAPPAAGEVAGEVADVTLES
jgi:hypothetical protein